MRTKLLGITILGTIFLGAGPLRAINCVQPRSVHLHCPQGCEIYYDICSAVQWTTECGVEGYQPCCGINVALYGTIGICTAYELRDMRHADRHLLAKYMVPVKNGGMQLKFLERSQCSGASYVPAQSRQH